MNFHDVRIAKLEKRIERLEERMDSHVFLEPHDTTETGHAADAICGYKRSSVSDIPCLCDYGEKCSICSPKFPETPECQHDFRDYQYKAKTCIKCGEEGVAIGKPETLEKDTTEMVTIRLDEYNLLKTAYALAPGEPRKNPHMITIDRKVAQDWIHRHDGADLNSESHTMLIELKRSLEEAKGELR
jgi:hypothetical protein